MGRDARIGTADHWRQLAEAVIELRQHVEALEADVAALKAPREQTVPSNYELEMKAFEMMSKQEELSRKGSTDHG